jgi:hypothetical protein
MRVVKSGVGVLWGSRGAGKDLEIESMSLHLLTHLLKFLQLKWVVGSGGEA